jgi:peroxisomal enoyl-CoA hydratase 2
MADDELASIIGKPTGTVTVVVERGPVSNFATAVCDDSPVYHDPRAAEAAGFPAIPAPPTFAFVMANWGAFPELQSGDGDGGNPLGAVIGPLAAKGGLILHGEQSFEYHRPVLVGDVLRGEGRIVDAYTKESKGRTMTFVVNETVWREAATGEPVVTARFNVIHRA